MRVHALPLSVLLAALGGCATALPGPRMPTPLAAAGPATIVGWVTELRHSVATETRFDARFQEGSGAEASLRGAVVIAPPDSLRFDARGPLGSAARAVFVVGDSAIWAEPEEEVTNLVPEYDLLWALVGQARPPVDGDELFAQSSATVRAWRYVRGVDTVNYLLTTTPKHSLVAEVRRGGTLIGRVFTTFGADGRLAKAQLDVPSRPARLTLTFRNHRTPDSLPASLWIRPDDAP
ncbi:MAG TPA: hypothetical protein VFN22_13500 [Gemmatimonadales bacterium]|nr:hypothetical protein [Gemmatimonadales bacterium]